MELDLELDLPRLRGRTPVTATVVRTLEPSDLLKLNEEKGSTAKPLERISDRHHSLARALASGMSESEASFAVGISLSRVSILKQSPAFAELLEFYRKDVQALYMDMHDRLKTIAMDSAQILMDRLEDEPDKISTGQLMELVKMGADRTGFGPSQQALPDDNAAGAAARLDAARRRVEERKQMIDVTPNSTEPTPDDK